MIVYNYNSEPIFINIGVIADPNGRPGSSNQTVLLPPNGEGGLNLAILGIMTKEEKKFFDELGL